MKKIILTIISVVSGIAVLWMIFLVISSLIIGGFFNPPIGKQKMEKIFTKDYELLVTVTNYLASSDYEHIYISDNVEACEMSFSEKIAIIDDVKVNEAINKLKEQGYNVIEKNDGIIRFQRWSIRNNGQGVVFSIDGSKPKDKPGVFFLTKLEQLSNPNWYYYEENFNEWKKLNE